MSKLLDFGVSTINASGTTLNYTSPLGFNIISEYTCYSTVYSLSNALEPGVENGQIFLSGGGGFGGYITLTFPKEYYIEKIQIESNSSFKTTRYTKGTIEIYKDEAWISKGSFDSSIPNSVTINKKINKFRIKVSTYGEYGVCIPFISVFFKEYKYLLKSEDKYYSIKQENYDEENQEYIPNLINSLSVGNFDNYGMTDLSLINSENIDNFIQEKFNVNILK